MQTSEGSGNPLFDPVVEGLTKDQREAAARMSVREARFLVDTYYQMQEDRKRAGNQRLAASKDGEPCEAITWLFAQRDALERRIRVMLDGFSGAQELGRWARSILGIGPVISAGLLCHIDILKAPNAGHIWSFAGLDPHMKWFSAIQTEARLKKMLEGCPGEILDEHLAIVCEEFHRNAETLLRAMDGNNSFDALVKAVSRRPWNARLKTLCWKIGDSFMKVSGNPKAFYGLKYRAYKIEEIARNERGDFQKHANDVLSRVPNHKQKAIYQQGRLPDGHILMRVRRRVVKLFLSHYHHVAYVLMYGEEPPRPWAIEHGGHTEYIPPPNWPM